MIWIDSSFAIEWLLGSERASKVQLPKVELAILEAQYAEIVVIFSKHITDLAPTVAQLESLSLKHATKAELVVAAREYLHVRAKKSKASLADVILATVAKLRDDSVATFDKNFDLLGCHIVADR